MAGSPRQAIWISRWSALFGLLVAILFFVFYSARVTVSLDGYSHLYQARVLTKLWAGQPNFRACFSYNSFLIPNWLATISLAGLSSVFPNETALKPLLTLIGAAVFCSLYFSVDVTQYDPRQRPQALIVLLPFALNAFLTEAFYGFLISSAICIFLVGLLLRQGLDIPLQRQLLWACALLIALFFHPMPVFVSLTFVCSYVISLVFHEEVREVRGAGVALGRGMRTVWPWVPASSVMVWFVLRLASAGNHAYSIADNVKDRAVHLMTVDTILSISPTPTGGALFILLLGVLAAGISLNATNPSPRNRLGFTSLTVFIVLTLILYFFAPDQIGDATEVGNRLLLYAIFALVLLALRGGALDSRLLTLSSILAAVIVMLFAGEYLLVSRRLSPALVELRSAVNVLPKYSRVLMLSYRLTPTCKRWPLLERTLPEWHWAMSTASAGDLIVLNDYQATTTHFPLKYADSRFASVIKTDLMSDQQRAAWTEVLSRNDPDVDFLVSWGVPSGVSGCSSPIDPPFEETLRMNYDRVFFKQGTSRVTVWRRRKQPL